MIDSLAAHCRDACENKPDKVSKRQRRQGAVIAHCDEVIDIVMREGAP
jgi:hypothetical protein